MKYASYLYFKFLIKIKYFSNISNKLFIYIEKIQFFLEKMFNYMILAWVLC